MTKILELKGASWTKGKCEILSNFLRQQQDLPIVANNADVLFNEILRPAFQNV